jgi:glucuronate isomerase
MSRNNMRVGIEPLLLDEDRCFDSDPVVRRMARSLYEETRDLPLICPHGHVDPKVLAENVPFENATSLFVTPDHYILRMLYSRGIPMESLGVPTRDGTAVERDPRKIWQTFGEHYYLFRGTPTGFWLDHELHELFLVRRKLTGDTAQTIYDAIEERLASPEFRPRALFERFRIEALVTTDAATDTLESHRAIRESGWAGRVLPSFRPDALFQIAAPQWRDELAALARISGEELSDVATFLRILSERRAYFKSLGATSTDHGVEQPYTEQFSIDEMARLFARGLSGKATPDDQRRFEAQMLMAMASMSIEDGLVMQIHAGALRNHNSQLFDRFGPNTGADIPVATEYTRNLRPLLNAYGNDARLTLVLFTLDESTYSRELAPLAGHYPAVRLGPPWWFHDSIEGMNRFRRQTMETAGIYNTAGFNDDTRAFCSIPARHDLSRRVDANFLAALVARHLIDMRDARQLARALAYELAKETYKLNSDPIADVY